MKLISNKEAKYVKFYRKSYFSLLSFFYKKIRKTNFINQKKIRKLHFLNCKNFLLSGYFITFWYINFFSENKNFRTKKNKKIFISIFNDDKFLKTYFEFSKSIKETIIDNSHQFEILSPEELEIRFASYKKFFLEFVLFFLKNNSNVNSELVKLFNLIYPDLFLFTIYEWYVNSFKFVFEYKKENTFEYEKNSKVVFHQLCLLSNVQLRIKENKFLKNFNNLFILITSIRKSIIN